MRDRWRVVVRATAICVLLMAVSPITAPFSTLDLGLAGGSGPVDSAAHKLKASSDGISVAIAGIAGRARPSRVGGRSATPPNLTERQRLEQRVLRI